MFNLSAMSESTGTISVKKTSKCAVTIAECATNGAYIRLENNTPKVGTLLDPPADGLAM